LSGGWRYAAFAAFVGALVGAYFLYQKVPRAFIPEDDEGYLIVIVQAPQGASLEYTLGAVSKVEAAAVNIPEVEGVFSVGGVSFSGSAPNRAIVFVPLKSFREREGAEHTAAAVLNRLRGPLMGIPEALVIPFNPPAIQGLGEFGGFQFVLEDQGRNTLQALADTANQLVAQSRTNPDLAGLFSSFTANDPQYLVHLDREKAKSLQVPLNQVTDALQVYMGSVYVNDFDFNSRSCRVYVQADSKYRSQPKDIRQYYLRSDPGRMIPLDNLVTVAPTANAQVISHYNLFRSAEIDGSAAPGHSSGEGIAAMEVLSKKALPQGMTFEWSGLSLEEIQSGGKALILFG